MYINHRGLNRFHRGHTAYIPGRMISMKAIQAIYIWYIGRVTSMKAIQAPMILIIKRIIQLGQAMIKITFSYYLYICLATDEDGCAVEKFFATLCLNVIIYRYFIFRSSLMIPN